jgi:hypothetical protein
MDMLLGGLAFAAIIFGQFAAVVVVHAERKSRESDVSAPTHLDHRAPLFWASGS